MTVPQIPNGEPGGTPAGAPEDAPPAARRPAPGSALLVTLSIVCGVLLIATISFSTSILLLSLTPTEAGAEPTASMTPAESAEPDPLRTVQGRTVTVVSDIDFGYFFMSNTDARGFTSLYSQIHNDDEEQAVTAFFDISLYDEGHVLVSRWSSNEYLLPGQTTLFNGTVKENMLGVASIAIEQISIDHTPPAATGTLTLDEMRGGDGGLIEGTFTSTLGAPAEFSTVYLIGAVGDEIFAVCWDYWDLPAEGEFRARCTLEPTSRDEPEPIGTFPEDAVFTAFYTLDTPL